MKVIFRFAKPARELKNRKFLVNLKVSFVAISVFHVLSDFSKANSLWEVELKSSITVVPLAKHEEIRFFTFVRILGSISQPL